MVQAMVQWIILATKALLAFSCMLRISTSCIFGYHVLEIEDSILILKEGPSVLTFLSLRSKATMILFKGMTMPGQYTYTDLTVQIVGMKVNTNNRAQTVLTLFEEAVDKYHIPSRIRVDRGGENLLVAVFMIKMRGLNRGSCMYGS